MKKTYIYLSLLLSLKNSLIFTAAQEYDIQKMLNDFSKASARIRQGKEIEDLLEENPALGSINIREVLPQGHPTFNNPPTLLKVAVDSLNLVATKQLVKFYGARVDDKSFDNGLNAFCYLGTAGIYTTKGSRIALFLAGKQEEICSAARQAIAKDRKNGYLDSKEDGPFFRKFFKNLDKVEKGQLRKCDPSLDQPRKNAEA